MKQAENIQDVFLNRARKAQLPLTIHMVNGYQINHAVIQGYDSFVILIEAEGKQMLLYKHSVSTITPKTPVDMRRDKGNADA